MKVLLAFMGFLSVATLGSCGLSTGGQDSNVAKPDQGYDLSENYTLAWFDKGTTRAMRMAADSDYQGFGNKVEIDVITPNSDVISFDAVSMREIVRGQVFINGRIPSPDWFNVGYMCLPRLAKNVPGFRMQDLENLAEILAGSPNSHEYTFDWIGKKRTAYWLNQVNKADQADRSIARKLITSEDIKDERGYTRPLNTDSNCQYLAVFTKVGYNTDYGRASQYKDYLNSTGRENVLTKSGLCWYGLYDFEARKTPLFCSESGLGGQ